MTARWGSSQGSAGYRGDVRATTDLAPRTVVASLLRPGDQIITADLLKATVTVLDARDPKLGRWVECITEDGRTLRFAARADVAVMRLRASAVAAS
jgi:hypothetical protein